MPIHDMVAPVLSAVSRAIELILDESAEILDGIIGVPAFSKESFVPFAKSALGDWVVRGEFPNPVEVERNHDISPVPGEIEASGQLGTPVPVVMENAWAPSWECIVFWVGQLHDFSRHFPEPCSSCFRVFTVQDVAKLLTKSWGKHAVGFGGDLAHCGKDQPVVVGFTQHEPPRCASYCSRS